MGHRRRIGMLYLKSEGRRQPPLASINIIITKMPYIVDLELNEHQPTNYKSEKVIPTVRTHLGLIVCREREEERQEALYDILQSSSILDTIWGSLELPMALSVRDLH